MFKCLIVFVALVFAWPAQAAINLVQSGFFDAWANGASSYSGLTLTHPITAGSILIVAGMFDPAASTITVADNNGDTITDSGLGLVANVSIPATSYVKVFLTPTSGTSTISLTFNTGVTYGDIYYWEVAGFTSVSVDKKESDAVNGGPFPGGPVTGTSTGTLLSTTEFAAMYGVSAQQFNSATSPWIQTPGIDGFASLGAYQILSSTAAIQAAASVSTTGQLWCVTFKGTVGPPSVSTPSLTLTGVGGF